jgi:sodium/bile acid cotransporter 7
VTAVIRRAAAAVASEWFLAGMVAAVVIASAAPQVGRSGGLLGLDAVADWGVVTVFFLHGVSLSTERLRQGLARWRVHLIVQGFTFGIFPVIWLVMDRTVGPWLPQDLMLGFLYLCALPSTVSSSVAMTALARGNVAASIFNATLSILLGVVLTPLLVSVLVGYKGGARPLGDAVLTIGSTLLLPFAVGQVLRPLAGGWFARRKAWTTVVDRGVILLLVFVAFSDSVADGLWTRHGSSLIVLTLGGTAAILATVLFLTRYLAQRFGFTTEDEITTVFCGSKKTLASGVPMAKVLFGAHPALGVIVLPLMFYHQLQLFVCSVLAQRYARRPAV